MTATHSLFVFAAVVSLALGGTAVARPPRGVLRWSFAAGMAAFALESVAR